MKELVLLVGAATILSGCITPEMREMVKSREQVAYVVVDSAPRGATVSFYDGTSCVTPCRVGVKSALEMQVAHIGYQPVRHTISKSSPSPFLVTLEPVGRSTGVEQAELPDL